jgi:class 3 adenylate cyclase/tetratricopeptide (TPR) repeat protein
LENRAAARFCGRCGAALTRACPSCGAAAEPDLVFCTACGASLEKAAPPPARLGDERKVVTVLFADLVGFTASSEQLDPEDVRGTLMPYYARLRRELERFGGTVEKFIGDAVMALFGAPVAHEDDPERAVRSALAIRDATIELAATQPALDLQVRIGVNTGETLVALGARPSAGEAMATGDVVNTCARLQAAAPVNGILVGEATFRATRRSIEYREVEPIEMKGKRNPVRAWEVLRLRADAGVDRMRRGAAPLVGRRQELDLLVDALERARRHHRPQLVTLVGVPGIGKSRLVFELFRLVEAEPELIEWRQGRCLPYGDGITFWALTEIVKPLIGTLEGDTAEEVAGKLRRTAAELGHNLAEARWLEEHLRALVGVTGDVRGDRRTEAFAAWRRFFEALAERVPVVLVFEDLHWADEGLLDFLDHLVEWTADVPLLVVTTTRPELYERRPAWGGGKRNSITVSLTPLSRDETATLVDTLVEGAVLPAEAQAALLEHAEGNPLYAEEYVRMLLDRRLLRRNGAAPGVEPGELPLPESVWGIIAARLDALPPDEKALLQDASVLGREFWIGALQALGGDDAAPVEQRTRALERRDLVRSERHSSLAGERQYSFSHALVRDVAYGQIARAPRAEKHRLAAEWLELRGPVEEQAEMLAHHYGRALELARAAGLTTAGLVDPARRALRVAGDRAWGLTAAAAAARFYASALALTPEDDPERAELLFRTGHARLQAEEGGEEELTRARETLLLRGDRERAAEADVLLYRLHSNQGRRDVGLGHLERAAELLRDVGPCRAKTTMLCNLARFRMLAGERDEAIRVGTEALRSAQELGLDDLQAEALDSIGVARFAGGDPGGVEDLERALSISRELGSPEIVRSLKFVAGTRVLLGELERSYALFAEGLQAAERFGDAYNIRWLRAIGVMEHYWSGRWDDAVRDADTFVAQSVLAPHYMEATCRRVRGQIRLARGDVDGALDDGQEALASDRRARDPWFLNASLAFCARVLAAAGRTDEASQLADELLEIWRTGERVASFEAGDLAAVLAALDRERDLRAVRHPTRWVEAAASLADDPRRAAELFGEIGSRPDEAYARLRAAASLPVGERGAELARAAEFFRSVGATASLREADGLAALA